MSIKKTHTHRLELGQTESEAVEWHGFSVPLSPLVPGSPSSSLQCVRSWRGRSSLPRTLPTLCFFSSGYSSRFKSSFY